MCSRQGLETGETIARLHGMEGSMVLHLAIDQYFEYTLNIRL